MKRITAALLCLTLALLTFAGCTRTRLNPHSSDEPAKTEKADKTEEKTTEPVSAETKTAEPDRKMSADEIYETCLPSVVRLEIDLGGSGSLGSGFFVDDKGTVVTNYHVIDGGKDGVIVCSDGREFKIRKVLGYSEEIDIAVLETEATDTVPLVPEKETVKNGSEVFVIGAPRGFSWSISNGIVSNNNQTATHPNGKTSNYIQYTAPISPGNSGGPIMNDHGRVIGIVVMFYQNGQNLNFAIPIEKLSRVATTASGMTLTQVYETEYGVVQERDDWISGYVLKDADLEIHISVPRDVAGDIEEHTENGVEYCEISYETDDVFFYFLPQSVAGVTEADMQGGEFEKELVNSFSQMLQQYGLDTKDLLVDRGTVMINEIEWSEMAFKVDLTVEGETAGTMAIVILYRLEGNTLYALTSVFAWMANENEEASRQLMQGWSEGIIGSVKIAK